MQCELCCKGLLDEWGLLLRLRLMKILLKVCALVGIAGVLGSCGAPMAALRSVGNLPNTARNALSEVDSMAGALYGGL